MPIKILPDEVASQIAAGEVVERPASVVKELIENSLDAGSSQISILIRDAGRTSIQVTDNGVGIPSAEMTLSVARHATSKLQKVDDLYHIQTLGFRGEALASIASVSMMTILSRNEADQVGTQLKMQAGNQLSLEKVGKQPGTTVVVDELFFNVPARLKFLKSNVTEKQQIEALVSRYALAYPKTRFELTIDGKIILRTNGQGEKKEILYHIYGPEISRQLIEFQFQDANFRVEGYISPSNLTKANRKEIIFFVNGRWIQDASLTTSFIQAYHSYMMVGRFPMGSLFISMPPEEVDVNVHPAKAAVRFRQPDRLFGMIQRAVKRALFTNNPFPEISLPTWEWRSKASSIIDRDLGASVLNSQGNMIYPKSENTSTDGKIPLTQTDGKSLPLLRVVGQVALAYIIAEGPDGLYLIDQHAAHERVLFEKLAMRPEQPKHNQSLLVAQTLEIPPHLVELFSAQIPVLKKIGFGIEPFGGSSFQIRSIPSILTGIDPVQAVKAVVEDIDEDETPLMKETDKRLVARICKQVAVKAGKPLSLEEQKRLVEDLENCENPRNCPHGRPTMIHLSAALLERQFGRRGSI